MRIGIDFRILSAGPLMVSRGMGRYTQQQIREVVQLDCENEYVLFCAPGTDLALMLPEIRSAPNVRIAFVDMPAYTLSGSPNASHVALRCAEEYQDWVYQQRVDLYHATTPLWWNDVVLPRFDACPMVATFYDVIPLIYPKQYLGTDRNHSDLYARSLSLLSGAERLISISEASRRDAVHYLGFPSDRIDLAYPIADPWFRVLPPEVVHQSLRGLRASGHQLDRFVMSVPGLHYSKNLEMLLIAYAKLPPSLRRHLPLVLVLNLSENDRTYIQALNHKLDITHDVILTGFVTEYELAALYNAATMLVHPSRYEGFGLPVLEAMQCGAPVITSTTSSLPEVGAAAAWLVDPDDTQGWTNAIETLATDAARRQSMRDNGILHAKKFSPTQLGENTLASYRQALRPATRDSRPRLALWTPLPPQASGIADYGAELLKELVRSYDVEVFVDDGYLPAPYLLDHYAIQHHTAFPRRQAQRPFDLIVYQLGASDFHLYMYPALQRWPGVAVLHDLVWSLALYVDMSRAGRQNDFTKELVELEGQQALQAYRELGTSQQTLMDFFTKYNMLKRIVENSRALVVSSDSAKRELEEKFDHSKVHVITMGVEDPWRGLPFSSGRYALARRGLSQSAFVVGVFGIIDPVKRVDVCIKAFGDLKRSHPEAQLWIVGQAHSQYRADLQDLIRQLDLTSSVHLPGRVAQNEFQRALLACDVVVTLRYPSRKQMSAVLMRAIAAGKPIIATNLPEWDFPQDFCWYVTPDEHETETLAAHLRRLADDPALCRQMASRARAFFERQGHVSHMARQYTTVFNLVTDGPKPPDNRIPEEGNARARI